MEETENLVNNIVHLAALLHFDRYRNRNRAFVCYVFSDLFYHQCSPTYLPTLSSPGLRCWGLESYEAGWREMEAREQHVEGVVIEERVRELAREGRVLEMLRKSLVPTSSDRAPRSLL